MRNTVRTIIIDKGKILLIHRIKKDRVYYVPPGGGVEDGETEEQAAIREAKEETGFDVRIGKKLGEFEDKHVNHRVTVFSVSSFEGKLQLGGPEAEISSEENQYILEWTPLSRIKGLTVYPEGIKKYIEVKK
jgi:8-oxo-dGTP diphosphatase